MFFLVSMPHDHKITSQFTLKIKSALNKFFAHLTITDINVHVNQHHLKY